jgi:hypothetical protein
LHEQEENRVKNSCRVATCAFFLFGSSGCLSMLFDVPKVKSKGYQLSVPPAPWRKIDAGTSDLAYQHPADHSMISVNSVCGQYQDQTLDDLTKGVALGLAQTRVTAVDKLEEGGFPAQRTTVEGRMGAVPMTVSLTVVRSDRCVYDFMLVARSAQFAQHVRAFEDAVDGFSEEPSP